MPTDFTKRVFRPVMLVGELYAKRYGSTDALRPIGNVLELAVEHKEDVITVPNMRRLGGGVYADVRRVTEASLKFKTTDLNLSNMARSLLGIGGSVDSGSVTNEPHRAERGGLLSLAHISPRQITVKKGPDADTAVAITDLAKNFEVRPEGLFVLDDASEVADGDQLFISYSFADYATLEALTTKASELQLMFGGLNEGDGGKPQIVDFWRCSQSVTKSLGLIAGNAFGGLDIEGSILDDPTKTGTDISRYYRVRFA